MTHSTDSSSDQPVDELRQFLLAWMGGNQPMSVDSMHEWLTKYINAECNRARGEGQLIGVAKILDNLWDNSYYSMGKKASERIEKEMVYYFGENWTTDMYDFMLKDGESLPSRHPAPVPTLAELQQLMKEVE